MAICSCQRTSKKNSNNEHRKRQIKTSWKQRLAEAEKDHTIHSAFDVSKDTIILLRRSIGIELSPDKGKSWIWLAKNIFRFDEFSIDDKGVMWGLERWKGIHESSYCRMHSSLDMGKTWKSYELNTNKFFPYHICSMPRTPLEVSDFWDKKLYRLEGSNPLAQWRFIKQLPNHDNDIADLSVGPYSISRENENNKLYVKRQNGLTDTLMSFTKAYNIYSIEISKDLIYVAGSSANDQGSYFAVIRNERLLRDFTIPGFDLNLTRTPLGRIYLTNSEGAFLYTKDTLVHLYK